MAVMRSSLKASHSSEQPSPAGIAYGVDECLHHATGRRISILVPLIHSFGHEVIPEGIVEGPYSRYSPVLELPGNNPQPAMDDISDMASRFSGPRILDINLLRT